MAMLASALALPPMACSPLAPTAAASRTVAITMSGRNGRRTRSSTKGQHMHMKPSRRTQPHDVSGSNRIPVGRYPALVLNADYTPLSYMPLSLWSWQDSVKAIFRGAVTPLSSYENVTVRSPTVELELPSVVVLKQYQSSHRPNRDPILTRRNVFLRDGFSCGYCLRQLLPSELTYDHVVPRAKGGPTTWDNVVAACPKCNVRKGSKLLRDLPPNMKLHHRPYTPTWYHLQAAARRFPPKAMHEDWADFLGVPLSKESESQAQAEELRLDLGDDWGI